MDNKIKSVSSYYVKKNLSLYDKNIYIITINLIGEKI